MFVIRESLYTQSVVQADKPQMTIPHGACAFHAE